MKSADHYVPAHDRGQADLVVRPDRALIAFALRVPDEDQVRGLATLQAAVGELAARLQECGAQVRLRGLENRALGEEVLIDGSIELALPESADFFARARLVSQVVKTLAELDRAGKAKVKAAWRAAEWTVHDPEAHRAALLALWARRAQELTTATGGQLHLASCQAPQRVRARSVSAEEVALELEVSCTFDGAVGPR